MRPYATSYILPDLMRHEVVVDETMTTDDINDDLCAVRADKMRALRLLNSR